MSQEMAMRIAGSFLSYLLYGEENLREKTERLFVLASLRSELERRRLN